MKLKCIDPGVGDRLNMKIVFSLAQDKGLSLSNEECNHYRSCEACRNGLSTLFGHAEATKKMNLSYGIVNRAERGDPLVLRRITKTGTALFARDNLESIKGLLVLITRDGAIHDAEERTLRDFEELD